MTKGLNETSVQILTWVVYALIILLSGATAYLMVENAKLSDKFVRLERYQADTARIEGAACRLESKFEAFSDRIETKIDVLILKSKE